MRETGRPIERKQNDETQMKGSKMRGSKMRGIGLKHRPMYLFAERQDDSSIF